MKRFLLPFLLAFSFLQVAAQTTTEISNILNTKVAQITTTNITGINNDAFSLDLSTIGYRVASLDLTGTWTATLTFQGSNDNFTTITSVSAYSQATGGLVGTITSNGHYVLTFTGFKYVRLRATAFTSGTAVSIVFGYFNNFNMPFAPILPIGASTEATLSTLNGKVPSGLTVTSNRLLVDPSGVTQPVSGTFWQATQPVSGTFWQATQPVSGTFWQATQPVSIASAITANIGTTNGLALDATLAKLTIAQGAALGSNTQALIGGSVTTAAPAYTTGQISPLSLTTAGLLRVDGSGVTQSISGSVTANAGTNLNTSALALETGGNLATVKTNTDNLALAQASTTSGQKGNLIMGAVTTGAPTYTTAQTSPISLTTAGEVRVINNNTQTISGTVSGSGTFTVAGTVTANAGTNLNTSLLALETGGNLATVKTNTDNLNNAQGSTTSGQKGLLMLTATTTAAPTYTTAQSNPLSTTTAGALRVDASATTQPVSGTVVANAGTGTFNIQANASINVAQIGATTVLTGNGATGAGSIRVTVANDNSAVPTKFSQTTTDNDVDVATIAAGTNDIGYVNPDRTTSTTTITTAGNGTSFACKGMNGVGLNITGTAATFVFKAQISMDGGTTWSDTWLDAVSGNKSATRSTNGQYSIILAGGTTHVRVVLNSIVSGNFTYQYSATMGHDPSILYTGVIGSGQSVPPLAAQIGGSDGTDLYPLSITAKGTQGAKAIATQDLKDAGRTNLIFYANAVASGTTGTETAITLTKASGTSATSTGTSFVITNGKTFRITSITVASRGNATGTAQITTFNLRINTGGAVTTASTPLVFAMATATPATASAWDRYQLPIPDGLEYTGNGTIQFGITANSVFVTNAPTWFVTITGYEY